MSLALTNSYNVDLKCFTSIPALRSLHISWDRSEAFEADVVAVGESKAHLLMRNTRRLRKDGSLIEEATGFYAYKKVGGEWKMFAISDIVFPA